MTANVTGNQLPDARVGNGSQREMLVTVLSDRVEHHFANRPSLDRINARRAEMYGTTDQLVMPVTLRSGLEVTVIVKTFTEQHGSLLFTGVIANGSMLTSVSGSIFNNERDGWMRLGKVLGV